MDAEAPVSIELLYEINAAFNSRDADRIVEYFTDDCTFMMARGPEPCGTKIVGKEALRKALADRFAKIPDMHWNDLYRHVYGNRAVSVWIVTGRSEDGEVLNFQGCDLYEFKGGKVHVKDTYWKQVTK